MQTSHTPLTQDEECVPRMLRSAISAFTRISTRYGGALLIRGPLCTPHRLGSRLCGASSGRCGACHRARIRATRWHRRENAAPRPGHGTHCFAASQESPQAFTGMECGSIRIGVLSVARARNGRMRDFDCSAGASVGMSRRQSRTNLLDCPSSPRSVPAGCLVQLTSAADWNSALETRSPVELVHRASSDISWMHPTSKSFAEL